MSTHESVLPPALVLGSGITALGVVRGLGRRGIPRHVLSADPVLVRASRWYRPPPGGQRLRELSDLAGYLRSLPLEGGVLIPTSDHAALAAAGLPPDLAARFPTSQAPASVLAELLDKEKLRRLLAEHDVPHPRTIPVDGPLDLEDLGDVEVERLFVKPRDSQEFSRRLGVKALRAGSREALRTALDRVRREGLPVVLQEYVPGPAPNHYFLDGFVDRAGVVRARFARRRLRAFPPEFGNSCATISVPLEEMAPAASDLERLFAAVGYRGPYDAEFKLDERTGVFRLLEINVRAWWQVEFAALCGVDVVPMCYRDALGFPVGEVRDYDVGVKWMLPYRDFIACRRLLASGQIRLSRWVGSWLTSYWGEFAADDPLPGLAAGADLLGRRLLKRSSARSRVRRSVSPPAAGHPSVPAP